MKIPWYMKPKYPTLVMAGLGGLFTVMNLACAQTWTPTSAPSAGPGSSPRWNSVASSADGTKLVAAGAHSCFYGCHYLLFPIYTSADSGMTWIQTTAPINNWTSVASSADGTKLVAVGGWTLYINDGDTEYLGGPIHTSADSGATWTQTSAPSIISYSVLF